ncbi:MAG TPA: hypothetical protein V6D47_11460 [Oscillatoriaceae cyanobacterium]
MYEEHASQFHAAQDHAAPVVWVSEPTPAEQVGREADPYDVINFLLKKVEEQQTKLVEQEGYAELQNQEISLLKEQLTAAQHEIEAHIADNEVLMQNALAVEHELDGLKRKANEKPTIKLPFYTEQKLAKLGYSESPLEERQAV